MDNEYHALNEFLDKCINDALQETTDKFQVGIDHSRGFDYDQYKDPDRFNGFKEDKNDSEGEKMKDYERPPPYKIYQRPLTADEAKSYNQHQEYVNKLRPGQARPNWDGYDEHMRGFDKTEDYSKYVKPRSTTEQPKGTTQNYPHSERKQDPHEELYKSSPKPESNTRPIEPDWTHKKEVNNQEEPHISRPKINPNLYQRPSNPEEKVSKERWTFKPKFSNVEKPESTYQVNTNIERPRRFSDPAASYKPKFTCSEDTKHKGQFHTYENFYKNVANSDLKPDNNDEKIKQESPLDAQKETKSLEKEKDKNLPGMNGEEVKQELLKLRPSIVDRSSWGALPPMGKVNPMKPPADTVVFTLNTGTPGCITEQECRRSVRELQARHMGKGLGDIQYNFLVGGDGNLYEGRGWEYESGITPEKQQGKNYNIAFIGDYQENVDNIPPHMLGPVQDLIVWGNALRLMTNDTKGAGEYRVQRKEAIQED